MAILPRNKMLNTQMTVVPAAKQLPALVQSAPNGKKPTKDDIRYIHLRNHRYDPSIGSSVEIAVIGEKATILDAKGGATIAYFRVNDEVVVYAFSQCCIKDVFSRKLGRKIASNRLLSGMSDKLFVEPDARRSHICKLLIEEYLEYEGNYNPAVHLFIY